MDPMVEQLRETYNVPGEAPREAMWAAIESKLEERGDAPVLDLTAARERRASSAMRWGSDRSVGWAVAAAAVLVLGVGIGRMTAPEGPAMPVAESAPVEASQGALTLAARDHFGRTESLLTMVRADARAGRVDPLMAQWASGLLSETRMLLDAQSGGDPAVDELLLDLELVLIQIVGVAETGSLDEALARTELELTLRTLEDGEVLPRIQAVLPNGMEGV
jgi:hypothetical protein